MPAGHCDLLIPPRPCPSRVLTGCANRSRLRPFRSAFCPAGKCSSLVQARRATSTKFCERRISSIGQLLALQPSASPVPFNLSTSPLRAPPVHIVSGKSCLDLLSTLNIRLIDYQLTPSESLNHELAQLSMESPGVMRFEGHARHCAASRGHTWKWGGTIPISNAGVPRRPSHQRTLNFWGPSRLAFSLSDSSHG